MNAELLELETLGPLKQVSAGETTVHQESWVVFSKVPLPDNREEEGLLHAMEPYKKHCDKGIPGSGLYGTSAQVKREPTSVFPAPRYANVPTRIAAQLVAAACTNSHPSLPQDTFRVLPALREPLRR
jgi:hypothetical protein